MNNEQQVTWTVCDTPPERAHKPNSKYKKWCDVFTQIAESTNGQWVQLDGELDNVEASSVYQSARRLSQAGTLGKVNIIMRTARVLDESFDSGAKKRMYHLFVNVDREV